MPVLWKNGTYRIVIYRGTDEKGKPIRKWHTPPELKGAGKNSIGKRDQKKIAEAYEVELLQKYKNGFIFDAKNLTVGVFLAEWIKRKKIAPKTFDSYKGEIERHIIPKLGNIKIEQLNPFQVQDYYDYLIKPAKDGGAGLSTTTAKYHHNILHSAFNDAMKPPWVLIKYNPLDNVEAPTKRDHEAKVLEDNDASNLILELGDENSNLFIPIVLAASMTMRPGEICGFRWSDIKWDIGETTIRKQLQRLKKDAKLDPEDIIISKFVNSNFVLRTVKTKKKGIKPTAIPNEVLEVLKTHQAKQNEIKMRHRDIYIDNGFVCAWEDGRPFEPTYLTKAFKKIITDKKLPIDKFYELRHTSVTLMLEEGIDAHTAAHRARHSNPQLVFSTYGHATRKSDKDAADKLGKKLMTKH